MQVLRLSAVTPSAPTLSTDLGPPAGSVCISPKARPSFAVHYHPLHRRPVSSHSPLLFDGNPQRCVFSPSTREGEERIAQGRGDSKVKWAEYERKMKSVNAKKGAGVEADEKTNDPASDIEAARVFMSPKAAGPPIYL